jgi:hypothetical protein
MQRKILSNSIALAAMLAVSAGVTARADVLRIISQPVVVPRVRTMVVPTTRIILPQPTVVRTFRQVIPQTTTTTTTTTIVPTEPVTTTTTEISETSLKQPNPPARLHNMMDQITLGESKGLLTAAESTALRAEYARLDSLITADLADGGLTAAENDDLERQLTVFNQQISDAMK